ncbi:MAG TPA: hypothetical protein IAA74_01875 [Candidatus Excrementavichristensenella intestinipullorum]|nr:hypothetical protein [Candidatus Excrementavichristensenella intestinipullorum]
MKKWAAWLLALMLWVSPLAAGAEPVEEDKLYILYLGNPFFSLNEEAEQSVDLALILRGGVSRDGRYILTLSAEGENPLAQIVLTGDGQQVTGYLGGMSSAYSITYEELAQLLDQARLMVQLSGQSLGLAPEDQQRAAHVLEALAQALRTGDGDALLDALAPYAALDGKGGVQQIRQLLPLEDWEAVNGQIREKKDQLLGIDLDAPDSQQEMEVLGKTVPMKGYAVALDGQDIGRIADTLAEISPAYAGLVENLRQKQAASLLAGGYPLSEDETGSLGSMYQALGAAVEGMYWLDQDQRCMKGDLNVSLNIPMEDGSLARMTCPMTVESYEVEEGDTRQTKMFLGADLSQASVEGLGNAGLSGLLELAMDLKGDALGGDLDLQAKVQMGEMDRGLGITGSVASQDGLQRVRGQISVQDGNVTGSLGVDGSYLLGENGAEVLMLFLDLAENGQKALSLGLTYGGWIIQEEDTYQRGGPVYVEMLAQDQRLALGLEAFYAHEPLTEERLEMLDAVPVIPVTQLLTDQEALAAAAAEAQGVAMSAMAELMQAADLSALTEMA